MKFIRRALIYLIAVIVPLLLIRPIFGMDGPHSPQLLARIFGGAFDWMDFTIAILILAILLIFVVISFSGGGIRLIRRKKSKK